MQVGPAAAGAQANDADPKPAATRLNTRIHSSNEGVENYKEARTEGVLCDFLFVVRFCLGLSLFREQRTQTPQCGSYRSLLIHI